MSDISNQLIKDSYNYVLQSDLSTGVVYRIGGTIPVNPIFQSGLTVNSGFTYSNGTEGVGYALLTDGTGYAYWAPVSAATPSSGVTSVTGTDGISVSPTTGNVVVSFTGTSNLSNFFLPLSGGTLTGGTIFQSGLTATTISATTYQNYPGSSDNYCIPTLYVSQISGCSPVTILTELKANSGLTVTGVTELKGSVTVAQGITVTGDTTISGYHYKSSSNGTSLFITKDNVVGGITSNYEIGLGENTLNNSKGTDNIAIGRLSLNLNNTGSTNVAIGYSAGEGNTNGDGNVYIGGKAGEQNNGSYNTFIGFNAGQTSSTNYSIIIGKDAGQSETNDYRLHIGTNSLIYGEFDNRRVGINITDVTNTLHVSAATNPVRFEGLQSSSENRYVVTDTNGVLSYTNTSPGGGIAGSGTTSYVPKWSNSTTLTDSKIYDNGTSIGVGTASPNAAAIIEIASTTQGVLFPRMTKVQRDAISAPPIGLILFVTDDNEGLYIYKTSGWVQII